MQREVLDGMFTFYDSTRAKLNIYQVFDVIFFAPCSAEGFAICTFLFSPF